jgi:hypothetical protein
VKPHRLVMEEEEVTFTFGKALESAAKKKTIVRGGSHDVDYIQDPATGRLMGSHPGAGGGEAGGKESGGSKAGGGKKIEVADFAKNNVALDSETQRDPDKQKEFVDLWNDKVGQDPGEFKMQFLGSIGKTSRMMLEYDDREGTIEIRSTLIDDKGDRIGEANRIIDLNKKAAASAFFRLTSATQGHNLGKQLLAANVATYQKLGIERVNVHANIDVGGYAWARYGYIPNRDSWHVLQQELDRRVDREFGSTTTTESYEADDWSMLSESQQEEIEQRWMRSTFDEFYDSEVDNWRDQGSALEQAKKETADNFDGSFSVWGKHAIEGVRKAREDAGKPPIPFSNNALLDAISVEYSSRYDDGKGDLDVTFDDSKLTSPTGYKPEQETLPGIPKLEPHEYLSQDMRDAIEKAMQQEFDNEADKAAENVEPPDYLRDGVAEFQSEMWGQKEDSEKLDWALRNVPDEYTHIEIEREEEEESPAVELAPSDRDRIVKLVQSDDPKAIWAIADSKYGKDMLLNTDWNGTLNLKDKASMDRFNAYVGKAKKAA